MAEEERGEGIAEKQVTGDNLRVVGKIHNKLDLDSDPKLQDEGYDGECDDGKCESTTSVDSALYLAKSRHMFIAFLKDVKFVSPILLNKFPSMSLRYKSMINKLKSAICDLPHSKDLLPTNIQICEIAVKSFHKEKEKNLWGNYTNSVTFKQLENTLKLLLLNMKLIKLKLDLEITSSEEKHTKQPDIKQTNIRLNVPAIKKDQVKIDQSKNRWEEILKEVPAVAPI